MSEREDAEPAYHKTHDYTVANKPLYWRHGVFRIRIFEKSDAIPIVLASPLSPKPEQAVVDVTPYLAAEILARHFTCRLWEEESMRWIEEAIRVRRKRGGEGNVREYWQVNFRSFSPRATKVQGEVVLQLDERGRHLIGIADLELLLGVQLDNKTS